MRNKLTIMNTVKQNNENIEMNNLNMVIQAIIHKSETPLSGYDIAKMIKNKTGNSHQQVYRELNKLSERSDVKVETIIQYEKPDRKVYSFTSNAGFVSCEPKESDLTKTNLGYAILTRDILSGTNNYDSYVAELKSVEKKYKDMW